MPLSSLHMVFSRKHSFYYSFIYLKCIFGCTGLLHGLSLVEAGEDSSQAAVFKLLTVVVLLSPSTGSRCSDFSGCGFQALEHRLIRCGAWAWFLCGTWNLPGPGIKPVSPVLAGRFLSTVPPGKSKSSKFFVPKVELLGLFSPL